MSTLKTWDEEAHPRHPAGTPVDDSTGAGGGRFAPKDGDTFAQYAAGSESGWSPDDESGEGSADNSRADAEALAELVGYEFAGIDAPEPPEPFDYMALPQEKRDWLAEKAELARRMAQSNGSRPNTWLGRFVELDGVTLDDALMAYAGARAGHLPDVRDGFGFLGNTGSYWFADALKSDGIDDFLGIADKFAVYGLDVADEIEKHNLAVLLGMLSRTGSFNMDATDFVMLLTEEYGLDGDEFPSAFSREEWGEFGSYLGTRDLYNSIMTMVGPPSAEDERRYAYIAPGATDTETHFPDDMARPGTFAEALRTGQFKDRLDAGERVATVVLSDDNRMLAPEEASMRTLTAVEKKNQIDPDKLTKMVEQALPDDWSAAIAYKAQDEGDSTSATGTVNFRGIFLAGDDKKMAGTFSVTFATRFGVPHSAYLNYLELEEEFQNNDAAIDLMGAVAKHAMDAGFESLSMVADVTIGKYAWAKYGFDFDEASDYHDNKFDQYKFMTWLGNKGKKYIPVDGLAGLDDIKTPYDIATYDPDPNIRIPGSSITNQHVSPDHEMHLGKAYMLDKDGFGDWDAVASPEHVYQLIQFKKAAALARQDAGKALKAQWDEEAHPRHPAGTPVDDSTGAGGGRFAPKDGDTFAQYAAGSESGWSPDEEIGEGSADERAAAQREEYFNSGNFDPDNMIQNSMLPDVPALSAAELAAQEEAKQAPAATIDSVYIEVTGFDGQSIDLDDYDPSPVEARLSLDPSTVQMMMAEALPAGWTADVEYSARVDGVDVDFRFFSDGEEVGSGDITFLEDEDYEDDPENPDEPYAFTYLTVKLSTLELYDGYQGTGAAEAMLETIARFAMENEYEKMEMLADITIGKYAWAKYGFDFADGRTFDPDRFREWARGKSRLDGYELPDLDKIQTPHDLATYDPDPSIRLSGYEILNDAVAASAEMHLGKAYMLDDHGFGDWQAQTTPENLYQLIQFKKAAALARQDAGKALKAAWDEEAHPRHPAGTPVDDSTGAGGGRFAPKDGATGESGEGSAEFDFEGDEFDPDRMIQESLIAAMVPAVSARENAPRADIYRYDPIIQAYAVGDADPRDVAAWLDSQFSAGITSLEDVIPTDMMVDLAFDLGLDNFTDFGREFIEETSTPQGGYIFQSYDQSLTTQEFINAWMERASVKASDVAPIIEDLEGWPDETLGDLLSRIVDPVSLPGIIMAETEFDDKEDFANAVADFLQGEASGIGFDDLSNSSHVMGFLTRYSNVAMEDAGRQAELWADFTSSVKLNLEPADNDTAYVGVSFGPSDLSTAQKVIARDYLSPQTVADMFDGKLEGFTLDGSLKSNYDTDQPGISYNATILDEYGNKAGTFTFTVRNDYGYGEDESEVYPEVYIDYLEIEDQYQNHGLAYDLIEEIATYAYDHGMEKISLLADITIGKYAWAKYGFNWDEYGGEGLSVDSFVEWLADKGVTRDDGEMLDYEDYGIEYIETAQDLANFDIPGVTISGSQISNSAVSRDHQMKVGKAYMLDAYGLGDWHGTVDPRTLYDITQAMRAKKGSASKSIKGGPGSGYHGRGRPGLPGVWGGSRPRGTVGVSWSPQVGYDLEDHFGVTAQEVEATARAMILPGCNGFATVNYLGRGELEIDATMQRGDVAVARCVFRLSNQTLATHDPSDPTTYHDFSGIHIDSLEIADGEHDSAAAILLPALRMAQNAGYERVTLEASGDVGRYAWAKYGMDFGDPSEVDEYNARFNQWMARMGIDQPARRYMMTPGEFAGFDSGETVAGSQIDNPYVPTEARLNAGAAYMLDRGGMPIYNVQGGLLTAIDVMERVRDTYNFVKRQAQRKAKKERKPWEPQPIT